MSPARKSNRGGARPGGGRPTRTGEPTTNRVTRWTAAELAALAALTAKLEADAESDSDADTIRLAVAELCAKHGIDWPGT